MMRNENHALLPFLAAVLLSCVIVNDVRADQNVPDFKVSAIRLLSSDGYISQKFQFPLRELSFCAFFEIPPYNTTGSQTLFTVREMKQNSTLTVRLSNDRKQLILEDDNRHIFRARIEFNNNFNRLCFFGAKVTTDDEQYWIMINSGNGIYLLYLLKQISFNSTEDTEIEFFVGNPSSNGYPSFNGIIAGLVITHGITEYFMSNYLFYDFTKEDSKKLHDQMTYANFNEWSSELNSTITNLSFFEMLAASDDIIPLDGNIYKDPMTACKQVNGRPIGTEEVKHEYFLQLLLKKIGQVSGKENNNTLVWIEKCIIFDVESKESQITCVPSNYPWTVCIYDKNKLFSFKRILAEYDMTPGSLYSQVKTLKYMLSIEDKVLLNNNLEYLKFRENENTKSQITFSDGNWVLNFSSKSDVWIFNETRLPLGKHTWYLKQEDRKQEIILSSCLAYSSHRYSCYNGECVEMKEYCDGKKDCADGSDELSCLGGNNIFIHLGQPERILQINHDIQISKIGEIKLSDRSLKVNLEMALSWLDNRFWFRSHVFTTNYNCSELPWHPDLQIFSSCDKKISVNPSISKAICFTEFKKEEENFIFKLNGHRSKRESVVKQKFQIQFELPCLFDYELFPFAAQTCNFCIGIQNDDHPNKIKFISPTTPMISYSSSSISNLGDFKLESLTRVVINNTKLNLSIDLSSPFNYYIVAGYLPSVLIMLVSYITLFFRLDLFSERIGVSLTSLLTMVFLFLETNSNVIKTSYTKYLDIWFLSMMTISVGLVCFNSLLHYSFWKREEAEARKKIETLYGKERIQETSSLDRETKLEMDTNGPDSSQRKLNRGARVVFPLLFLTFCLGYVISIIVRKSNRGDIMLRSEI